VSPIYALDRFKMSQSKNTCLFLQQSQLMKPELESAQPPCFLAFDAFDGAEGWHGLAAMILR